MLYAAFRGELNWLSFTLLAVNPCIGYVRYRWTHGPTLIGQADESNKEYRHNLSAN